MPNPTLRATANFGSYQWTFEALMGDLGIHHGALSINGVLNRYINDHIQWMWEQFLRSR